MNKYEIKLEQFHKTMDGCIAQVWKELSPEKKELAEEILIKAWEEEEKDGFHYTENQILASFLSKQILYPCYDAVFKGIFLNDSDYVLLKDLITWTIFEGQRKVVELKIISSEPVIRIFGDRIFRCDIVVILDDKEQCNVEMQLVPKEGLLERMVLQAAKLHASQAKSGMNFLAVKPTFALWIMPFDFTKLANSHNSARLRFDQDTNKIMSSDIQFHFFEFFKKKEGQKDNGILRWQDFFGMKTIEECNKLKERDAIMERAINNLASLSNNPNFRQNVVEESFQELGRKIELGAYYKKGMQEGKIEGVRHVNT